MVCCQVEDLFLYLITFCHGLELFLDILIPGPELSLEVHHIGPDLRDDSQVADDLLGQR